MSIAALSPLVEIEHRVQDRANAVALDLNSPSGDKLLRELIADEVDRWATEQRRQSTSFVTNDLKTLGERTYKNIAQYGPLTELLDDDDVWEIMINAPDQIFVKRHANPGGYHHDLFLDDEHVSRTITKLLRDAGTSHRKLDPAEGLQDAQLASGARVHIVHGDVSRGNHLIVNIRKFTGVGFSHLDELVERDTLSPLAADFLSAAVKSRLSILFAGAPGAGKTTLLSCCAAELDPSLRVVIAEEVFEADIPLANVASMQTRPARTERNEIDLRRLVSGFLRMAPDVAIVGEVRDREALPLLLTLSSGVTGYTTIHASSAQRALSRLRFIAQLSDLHELPFTALTALVSEAVDIVVHSERGPSGPQVTSILAVEDLSASHDSGAFTTTELFHRTPNGQLLPTNILPIRVQAEMRRHGFDLNALLQVETAT